MLALHRGRAIVLAAPPAASRAAGAHDRENDADADADADADVDAGMRDQRAARAGAAPEEGDDDDNDDDDATAASRWFLIAGRVCELCWDGRAAAACVRAWSAADGAYVGARAIPAQVWRAAPAASPSLRTRRGRRTAVDRS